MSSSINSASHQDRYHHLILIISSTTLHSIVGIGLSIAVCANLSLQIGLCDISSVPKIFTPLSNYCYINKLARL